MNHQSGDWGSQTSQSYSGASYSHPATTSMNAYSSYNQQPAGASQAYNSSGYGSHYYGGQMLSPQSAVHPPPIAGGPMPLPAMHSSAQSHYNTAPGTPYGQAPHQGVPDSTGQVAPVGQKPKVTATLWEDEGTICFQVECNGLCVARREDNHFINGTKLLNVAGMTRGRRDGILKSEKTRIVVKIGPMHLKGVWIPFDRALDFANREKITEKLYPLFVHNISSLIPQGQAARGTSLGSRGKVGQIGIGHPVSAMPSLSHHPSMPLPSQIAGARPGLDRAQTFPTPPTSASSVLNNGSEYWNSSGMGGAMHNNQPLAMDAGLNSARSMPSTPASTPPTNSLQSIGSYGNQSLNSGSHSSGQCGSQYGQSNGYLKNEMGPPSRSGTLPGAENKDIKQDPFANGHPGSNDGNHDQGSSYSSDGAAFGTNSHNGYSFSGVSGVAQMPSLSTDVSDQVNSTHHDSSTAQITPRPSVGQDQWTGYHTPPRTNTYSDSSYPSSIINSSNKRSRDDDPAGEFRLTGDLEALKRRKSGREDMARPGSKVSR